MYFLKLVEDLKFIFDAGQELHSQPEFIFCSHLFGIFGVYWRLEAGKKPKEDLLQHVFLLINAKKKGLANIEANCILAKFLAMLKIMQSI